MQNNHLKIMDNVWGEIIIEEKFLPIINSASFKSLRDKKQLGLTSKNPNFTGGQHTRYDHSIGTYHLAEILIQACREKFGSYITISQQEEEAFKLSALLHDIGHGPFSHSFERLSNISHEEETFNKIGNGEIHDAIVENFGEEMPERVLQILKNKERIKRQQESPNIQNEINFPFIVAELMSGAIDIDRLDYLSRDLLNVTGKKSDFTSIFNGMNIDLVNNMPRIVFDYNVISTLESYFIARFNSYNEIHFSNMSLVLDEFFIKLIRNQYKQNEITPDISESEINSLINKIVNNRIEGVSFVDRRYAQLLSNGCDQHVLHKSFESEQEREVFETRLKTIIPIEDSYYSTVKRSVTVYNKQKNNIFIKRNDIVKDFSDASLIVKNDISQDTIISVLDLKVLEHVLLVEKKMDKQEVTTILEDVETLILSKDLETEKKYTFLDDTDNTLQLKEFCEELGATYKGDVTNTDKYYTDTKGVLRPFKVAVRYRESPKENVWTIKLPASDSTSLTKRREYNEPKDRTIEQLTNILNQILKLNKIENIEDLKEYLAINTKRSKYLLKFHDSIIEIALDNSEYKGNKTVKDRMIETELKGEGNPISLLLLGNIFKRRFNLIDCNESKLERAERMTL